MILKREIGYGAGLVLLLLLCRAGIAEANDSVRDMIVLRNQQLVETIRAGDSKAVAEFYTDDAQILPPYSDTILGKEAIQRFWQHSIESGIHDVALVTNEVVKHGSSAYEIGSYTVTGENGDTVATGKYVVIWLLRGDRWYLHRDILSPTVPWTP